MEADRRFGRRVTIGLLLAALFFLVGYVVVRFIAVVVFAVFLYYAVRPIHRSLERFGLPRRVRAMLALVLFGIPFLVLLTYTVVIVALEMQTFLEAYDVQDRVLDQLVSELEIDALSLDELGDAISGTAAQASLGVVLVSLAGAVDVLGSAFVQVLVLVTLTYYMLIDGPRFVSWLLETYDESGALEAYAEAVDPELSATLFGNIVNVFVTALVGISTFYTYNLFAPGAVQVPFPALIGALAGVGSLIPVVGIKLVYLPVTLALAVNALLVGDPSLLVPVAALVAVSAVLVDFIPDFFIRAHISGNRTHTGMLLVSYIVGPVVFGFYGLFLAPILLILVINATVVLLPYALTGDPPGVRQSRLREYADRRSEPTTDRPEGDTVAPKRKP